MQIEILTAKTTNHFSLNLNLGERELVRNDPSVSSVGLCLMAQTAGEKPRTVHTFTLYMSRSIFSEAEFHFVCSDDIAKAYRNADRPILLSDTLTLDLCVVCSREGERRYRYTRLEWQDYISHKIAEGRWNAEKGEIPDNAVSEETVTAQRRNATPFRWAFC